MAPLIEVNEAVKCKSTHDKIPSLSGCVEKLLQNWRSRLIDEIQKQIEFFYLSKENIVRSLEEAETRKMYWNEKELALMQKNEEIKNKFAACRGEGPALEPASAPKEKVRKSDLQLFFLAA